ncbi:MAG: c-type cytochrome [Gemmatimonadales bacterium]
MLTGFVTAAVLALWPVRLPAVQQGAGAGSGSGASQGRETFTTSCSPCHTVGGGRLVGPDLLGVADRRDEAWIIEFVQHSQRLVGDGDPDAIAIFEEFNQIPMPDQPLSDDDVRAVLAYIREGSTAQVAPAGPIQATDEQVALGGNLFQGKARFANDGPTCNSCHHVANDAVTGGGSLARELTDVHSRLGDPGIRAILGSPPFPVMRRAYRDRPLTDAEVVALAGFLRRADEERSLQEGRDYGSMLFGTGVLGVFVLLGVYSLVWRNRSMGSVNQSIYDRQTTSTR